MLLRAHFIPSVPSFNYFTTTTTTTTSSSSSPYSSVSTTNNRCLRTQKLRAGTRKTRRKGVRNGVILASLHEPSLDLTDDNVRRVLVDARTKFAQIFDTSAGMTGQVELAEVDGPFVKISLSGRFWHKRSTVLARIANYLQQRIPEILEVDVEDEKQLDDSPDNF